MEQDIRLIALDLDGTTFNSDKKVTERTREAITAAIEQGVIVIPATGRAKNGLPEEFISIPGVRYALTSNGGAVVDLFADKVIEANYLDNEVACKVIDYLLSIDTLAELYHDGIGYSDRAGYDRAIYEYENLPQWFKVFLKRTRKPVDDLREFVYSGNLKIEKMIASFNDMALRQEAFEVLSGFENVSVVFGNPFNVEVNAVTATKGHSLLAFADKMGIDRSQIMACGDTMNDRSMLEAAGLAVAMGNADDDIKAIADYITLCNDDDGVAYAIEKLVLNKD